MNKVRITIETVNEKNEPIKGAKTGIAVVLQEEGAPHQVYFDAVVNGLTALIRHEGIRYANWERSVALESIDDAAADVGQTEGDTENE